MGLTFEIFHKIDKIKLPKEREEVMETTTSWMEEDIIKGARGLTIRLLRDFQVKNHPSFNSEL